MQTYLSSLPFEFDEDWDEQNGSPSLTYDNIETSSGKGLLCIACLLLEESSDGRLINAPSLSSTTMSRKGATSINYTDPNSSFELRRRNVLAESSLPLDWAASDHRRFAITLQISRVQQSLIALAVTFKDTYHGHESYNENRVDERDSLYPVYPMKSPTGGMGPMDS